MLLKGGPFGGCITLMALLLLKGVLHPLSSNFPSRSYEDNPLKTTFFSDEATMVKELGPESR